MDSSTDMFTKYTVEIYQHSSMEHVMDIIIEYTTEIDNQSAKISLVVFSMEMSMKCSMDVFNMLLNVNP